MTRSTVGRLAPLCLVLAAVGGAVSPAAAYVDGQRCIVDTPERGSRVHRWPRGPIVGRVFNGQAVVVHNLVRDREGFVWADISNAMAGWGWTLRQNVKCQ